MSGLSGSTSAVADALNLVSVLLNVGAVIQDRMLHRDSVKRAQEHHLEQVCAGLRWRGLCGWSWW